LQGARPPHGCVGSCGGAPWHRTCCRLGSKITVMADVSLPVVHALINEASVLCVLPSSPTWRAAADKLITVAGPVNLMCM